MKKMFLIMVSVSIVSPAHAYTMPQRKKRSITRAARATNRPDTTATQENDPRMDAKMILDKVQQMINGIFYIAKDPKNPQAVEAGVANVFGGAAAIATHASLKNKMMRGQHTQLKAFFENCGEEFYRQLYAYAIAHAHEFQNEFMID